MPQLVSSSDPTTNTAADDRHLLIALGRTDQHYRFLDQAFQYLGRVESDPEVVLLALAALAKLGLGGPARELIQVRKDLEPDVDVDGLRKSLTSVPIGRVPWDRFSDQFEANRNALAEHHPQLAEMVSRLAESRRRLDLFQTLDGLYHISMRETGKLRSWLPGLFDHAQVAALELPLTIPGPAAVVVGIALSELIDRACAATQQAEGAAGVPLFIVDTDAQRLAAWLHVEDRTDLLRDERVYFFIGPDAAAQYEQCLASNEDLVIPAVHLFASWARELGKEVEAIGHRQTAARNEAFIRLAVKHEERAQERNAAYWAQRLQPGAQILGFTSRFTTMLQYSMRDIGHALTELGYDFQLSIENADHCTHTTLTTSRTVDEADPALVILLNHFRSERAVSVGSVPVLTWIQDPSDIVLSHKTGEAMGSFDFACGYYQERCTEEFGYPASRFFPAPVPVSTRIFHDGPVEPEQAAQYACDVMYVGHLHDTSEEHLAKWHDSAPTDLHPLLNEIFQRVHAMYDRGEHFELRNAQAFVEQIASDLNFRMREEDLEQTATYFAYRLYDILFRRQALLWAGQWADKTGRTFKLYGNGWSRDPALAKYAVGPVEHGEPLRRAYRCAKLCLQTMPGGYRHQRTFEALVSGSLVLGRYVPTDFGGLSLEEYGRRTPADGPVYGSVGTFPSLACVVFRNAKEFATRAESFLNDDGRYRQVQHAFARIVSRSLTYTSVVEGLLKQIRRALDPESADADRC